MNTYDIAIGIAVVALVAIVVIALALDERPTGYEGEDGDDWPHGMDP